MTTDAYYIAQLSKKYIDYLRSVVVGEAFSPIALRGGRGKPESTSELHESVRIFQRYEKRDEGLGWRIEWDDWNSKRFGQQRWPSAIFVDTEADYLFLIGRDNEVTKFREIYSSLLQWNAVVRDCFMQRPLLVLEHASEWPGICAVIDYLTTNGVSEFYLRSLPVPVHTKFIERNKGIIFYLLQHIAPGRFNGDDFETAIGVKVKPAVFLMRWLDEGLCSECASGMEVLGITVEGLRSCTWKVSRIILVENEVALFMLPAMPGSLAICTKGYAVTAFARIRLFSSAQLYYWGDMDEDGFIILSQCRESYPHVVSLFMDVACLQAHTGEEDVQPGKYRRNSVDGLLAPEAAAFSILAERNGRLEQEKLRHDYVYKVMQLLDHSCRIP